MTFNVLLTGVGGTGVLTTASIIARAANLEGHHVSGIQLHGLAQRGGSIPTIVRFGTHAHAPTIPRGEADLILGLELIEPARSCYYADKFRTNFLVDTYQIVPVYSNLLKQPYPTVEETKMMVSPFAKKMLFLDAGKICDQQLGDSVYSNSMLLGIALKERLLPLKKDSVLDALKATIPRHLDENLRAFDLGLNWKRR